MLGDSMTLICIQNHTQKLFNLNAVQIKYFFVTKWKFIGHAALHQIPNHLTDSLDAVNRIRQQNLLETFYYFQKKKNVQLGNWHDKTVERDEA